MKLKLTAILVFQSIAFSAAHRDFALLDCAKEFPEATLQSLVPKAGAQDVGAAFRNAAWSQERIDELYSCLSAGTIPQDNPNVAAEFHHGAVIFPTEGGHERFIRFVGRLGIPLSAQGINAFAETLWKGKKFGKDPFGEPMLVNNVARNWFFPAKVYLGQSILDARKPSIIIDYVYSDDLPGYRDAVDFVASRKGLTIRDEIRMVQPGLYLGRAYLDGVFGLNFVLYKKP